MSAVFLKILNMSISASWLVLAVLLLRLVLKRAPKWVNVLLWGLVAVRLICPVSIESAFSLIPNAQTIGPEIMMDWTPEVSTGIGSLDAVVNPIISESFAPEPYASANPLQILIPLASVGWIIGIGVMLIYSAVSYLLLRRKVATAVRLTDNIYQSEYTDSPFVLGVFRPRVYLPFQMDGQVREYVIAHEQAHIRRKDHWWKPVGFLMLAIHWFNPIMWLGYILLCKDIELACDEKVIKEMDHEAKANYTQALVDCSVNRRTIAACPLAFGEVSVKERVKSVMNYKKPAFWIVLAAVVLCVAVAVCFLTNPATSVNEKLSVFIDGQIAGHFQTEESEGRACCVNWEVLGTKKRGSLTTVYMWVLYEEYSLRDYGLHLETGSHIPTLITVKKEDGNYKLIEYWEPRDGGYLEPGIRAKFPWYLHNKALDSQRYIRAQQEENEAMARSYFAQQETATEPIATYNQVSVTETVSHDQESYYKISAFVPATDMTPVNEALAGKILTEWKHYDSLTPMEQAASSHSWGMVYLDTDTWESGEKVAGVALENPLERIPWLEKTGFIGMESQDPSTPVSHVRVTANPTDASERRVDHVQMEAGYCTEKVRITLEAFVHEKAATITQSAAIPCYTTYETWQKTTGSGYQALVVIENCENNTGYFNEDYFSASIYWVQGNAFYRLRLLGNQADRDQIEDTMEQILSQI